jgi:aspartate kinase
MLHPFTERFENRVVMKFGGTSLATPELIRKAANRIADRKRAGAEVTVVVSAMNDDTDRLLGLAQSVSLGLSSANAELDAVLATGEQVSAGLMALALGSMGLKSRSFMATELPLRTDGNAGSAAIRSVGVKPLLQSLRQGAIPVVAGFQGVGPDGRITTLGRGGSDTTAVALAVALRAGCCEFYKDVDGVYAADPRTVPFAPKLDSLTFDEMSALVDAGAQVLHGPAVQLAKQHGLPLHLRSTFHGREGTWVEGARKTLAPQLTEERFA